MNTLSKSTYAALIAALGFSYIGYKSLKIYLKRRKFRHIPGPPTKGILGFYFGNFFEFKEKFEKKHNVIPEVFLEWTKQYGPIFKFQIFDEIEIFTTDPQAIKDIYVVKNFPKDRRVYTAFGFPLGERSMGFGLVTDFNNERWRHRRHLFNPSFNKQVLMSFMGVFNEKTDVLMHRLRLLADGKTYITLLKEMNNVTLDVISSVGFGMNTDSINDPSNSLNTYVFETVQAFVRSVNDPFVKFKRSFVKKAKTSIRNLRELGRNVILNRIKVLKEGGYVPDDLLTIMLRNNSNEEFDIEELIDDFVTFFIAGQETTANAIAFCILELGRNPDILLKLREEVDNVLGCKSEISYDDLSKLKYTSAVLKENLRLWSVVPILARRSNAPFKIGDYEIPADTPISTSSYVTGRCEENFPDNMKFNPDRFLNENTVKNYTYFPFSIGPRSCIGQNFAMMEGKILLAKFIQNFDFKLDQNQSFEPMLESSISPLSGTKCILSIRDSK